MGAAGFEIVQGSIAPQNIMLLLGVVGGVNVIFLAALAVDAAMNAAGRLTRGLVYRRRVLAWRLIWLAALPTLGPLALATVALLQAGVAARRQGRAVARLAILARRRVFRPLAGRPV